MTYTIDNRWSPGASGANAPDDAPAAYAARWIDRGDYAEILPDRQGFAYNNTNQRDRLIQALSIAQPHTKLDGDGAVVGLINKEWSIFTRRAGGYVYVDAWLTA